MNVDCAEGGWGKGLVRATRDFWLGVEGLVMNGYA